MFTGLAFLSGSALLGVGFVRCSTSLRRLLNPLEQLLWGLIVGWVLASLAVYGVASMRGSLSRGPIQVFTIVEWILISFLWFKPLGRLRQAQLRLKTIWRVEYGGIALVLALFTPIYYRLFSTHMFAPGPGGVYSGGSSWYDMSFHAALSSSFRYGTNFPPLYTFLPPEALRYPFIPDFQTAILMAAGMGLRPALISTSLVLALATTCLLYSFAYRVVRLHSAATLATTLFLLNGGLGFIYFIRDWWTSGKGLIQFWNTLEVSYANYSDLGIHWTNIIADILLPQRASLFGLPIALIVFSVFAIIWRRWHEDLSAESEATPPSWTLLFAAGLLTGLLPIIHTHTYIAVGLVSIFLFLFFPRRTWFAFWVPAVLVALPFLLPLLHQGLSGPIVRVLPGWLGHNEPFFPLYLLRNFGLPILLAIPALLALTPEWRKFYLAYLLLVVFCFLVVVSPNTFDNGKLTYYWHAVNSIVVASWLVKISTGYRQKLITVLLVVLCVATGVVALQYENRKWQRIFTHEEIAAADFITKNTSARALFLTAPAFNQPVTCLAGRPILRGPTSWLWSHGYDFREREADVRRIYASTSDALELLDYYHVDYIYLGDAEVREFNPDRAFFDNNFTAIYRSPNIAIYAAHSSVGVQVTGSLQTPAPRELASRLERDPYAVVEEFPRTSFFAYRVIKASFGRLPRRDEIISAMKVIGRQLLIGTSGWERQLEVNRTSWLAEWMKSDEFAELYDRKSNAEFVGLLLRNTEIQYGSGKREALIDALDSGTSSRHSVLLSIAENRKFWTREHNTAYVFMHFVGYLRRNPDDPPDKNLRGLNFWLDVLNRSGDYNAISRAFLDSEEYKHSRPVH